MGRGSQIPWLDRKMRDIVNATIEEVGGGVTFDQVVDIFQSQFGAVALMMSTDIMPTIPLVNNFGFFKVRTTNIQRWLDYMGENGKIDFDEYSKYEQAMLRIDSENVRVKKGSSRTLEGELNRHKQNNLYE